jgi:hypothetical protein
MSITGQRLILSPSSSGAKIVHRIAMDLREGADYGCIYNVDSARIVVASAREIFETITK